MIALLIKIKQVSFPVKIGIIILLIGLIISGIAQSMGDRTIGYYGLIAGFFGLLISLAYMMGTGKKSKLDEVNEKQKGRTKKRKR